jgi:hypothetical protein
MIGDIERLDDHCSSLGAVRDRVGVQVASLGVGEQGEKYGGEGDDEVGWYEAHPAG